MAVGDSAKSNPWLFWVLFGVVHQIRAEFERAYDSVMIFDESRGGAWWSAAARAAHALWDHLSWETGRQ